MLWFTLAACVMSGTVKDPVPPGLLTVELTEDCDVDIDGLETLPRRELLVDANNWYEVQWDADPPFEVIQDDRAYQVLQDRLGPLDPVDFDQKVVIAAWVVVGSSCGLRIDLTDVYDNDDAPHFVLEVTDTSGDCDAVCDAEGTAVSVMAIDRPDEDVTACITRTDVCE